MADNKMLIDATHPEETRVVVLRGGRVEEFDYESAARSLLRGNIYLAKVTRVEPALQAAFVDYGGNRHGFLAFNEVHPDYYQIPVADRLALIEEEAEAEARAEAEVDARAERSARRRRPRPSGSKPKSSGDDTSSEGDASATPAGDDDDATKTIAADVVSGDEIITSDVTIDDDANDAPTDDDIETLDAGVVQVDDVPASEDSGADAEPSADKDADAPEDSDSEADLPPEAFEGADIAEATAIEVFADSYPGDIEDSADADADTNAGDEDKSSGKDGEEADAQENNGDNQTVGEGEDTTPVEDVGSSEDALEELPSRPRRSRRSYKIQEVIKRRQVILIQVVKEERGNKGAALTTYLSLAGRYTVLMPNTARGGGISRKITNPQDRKRLKAIAQDLEVPEGMGLIIRTAGAARTKQEIRRDFEYLLRLWESVREMTLESTAPALVYEEGNLIKRSIRDLYNKDVDEVLVAGHEAYREAKSFMRMLMPSHAKNVTEYTHSQPIFTRFQIERQLNAMFGPIVSLKSGGYLVINQTEALVAIDVNSGKSTREFSIEETALNTNLEAAEETARQLRLRDLAGLIVIDFIDMDERRHNRAVERRMKDSLRNDRARIQVGRISHFGLMEMSRQRMRTGVLEGSTTPCPHCQGTGIIRSIESVALAVLRGLEDAITNGNRAILTARTTPSVAFYILNNKRDFINDMQARYGAPIRVEGDEKIHGANFTVDRGSVVAGATSQASSDSNVVNMDWGFDGNASQPSSGTSRSSATSDNNGDDESADRPKRRRRRGRRGRGGARQGDSASARDDNEFGTEADAEHAEASSASTSVPEVERDTEEDADGKPRRRRRRGRRGGRRARERQNTSAALENSDATEAMPAAANDGDGIPGVGPQPDLSVESDSATETAQQDAVDASDGTENARPDRRPRQRRRPSRARRPSTQDQQSTPVAANDDAASKSDVSSSKSDDAPASTNDVAASNSGQAEAPPVAAVKEDAPTGPPKKGWWQKRLLGDG